MRGQGRREEEQEAMREGEEEGSSMVKTYLDMAGGYSSTRSAPLFAVLDLSFTGAAESPHVK